MTTRPEDITLAAEFPQADLARWRELVATVLERARVTPDDADAPELALATTTYDGITVPPLFTAESTQDVPAAGMPGLAPFVRGARPEGCVDSGWDVRVRHGNEDPAAANTAILDDLEHGATSVWLRVGRAGVPVASLGTALNGVLLDLAPVVLDPGADYADAAAALADLHEENGVAPSDVRSVFGIDPIGVLARTGADPGLADAAALAAGYARSHPNARAVVVDGTAYHDAGGSDAQELGYTLAAAVNYLRALTDAGLDADTAAAQLEFRYAATADQFLTIAKLRAARRLWDRVGAGCGIAERAQHQHAVTSPAMLTLRDPWVNMLRTTVACFAAGVGGAESITVLPFDSRAGIPDAFGRRIARNTQAILLEESRLAGVIDPAGGSWYVEWLTDALARAAWSVFTAVERADGMVAALGSGMVSDALAATWERRRDAIAHRRDPITGVSEFANIDERPLSRTPYQQAEAGGGLPVVRYAQDYEALRDRADAHAERHDARPTVFLATLGPVAKHTARATFAANLFHAGGIATTDAGATETCDEVVAAFRSSGAKVACVCGTDSAYADLLGKVAPALVEAGATKVLLAGKPSDDYESPVDGFVFAGCDALGVLTETMAVLTETPELGAR